MRSRACLAVALIVSASCLPGRLLPFAGAQNFGISGMSPAGRFIEPPRSIRQTLSDAQQAIAAERYSEAVVELGDLLAREPVQSDDADLAGQDFFLDAGQGNPQTRESLLRAAEQMLGQMPAAGLDIYEARYGPQARRLLEEAGNSRDEAALREISRRFFHTAAGYEATLLLGYRELTEGRPVAAVAILRRLVAQSRAVAQLGAAAQLALTEAEFLAGIDPVATGQATGSVRALAGQAVTIAGQAVEIPAAGPTTEWLHNTFGALTARQDAGRSDTTLALGGPSRPGVGGGHLPLSGIRWLLPTTSSQRQQRMLEEFVDAAAYSNELPAPSWQPILVDGQLLMRTTERMVAVDFETGKRVWEYPWFSAAESLDEGFIDVDQMGDENAASQLLIQRVWNDLPYGRISSDGSRVFLLSDLGELEITNFGPLGVPGFRAMQTTASGSNTLVALDLETEGKLLWMRGKDADEPLENSLAEAFFLGPPLPLEGALYQVAELSGDTYLLSLDPASGRELWRQQLLANEGGGVSNDPIRRIGGAMPAYSDGILVCPTAAGAIVAFDLASRTLLWGTQYQRNDGTDMLRGRRRGVPEQTSLLRRWLDGTPMISEGRVLVSPVESDSLYGFDLLTGRPLWSPIARKDFRYLAGIRDGQFLLVSTNRVQAYSTDSGRPSWPSAFDLGSEEEVAGTGVFGDGVYLLPTTGKAIVEIDLETGELQRRRETEFPLGNLLATSDSIVSQDATTLAVAYAEQPLVEVVEQRLSEDADDHWAIVRRGELLLQEGKRSEAIEWLLRARRQDPQDEEVRVLLIDAMLAAIRQGETPAPEAAELLSGLIELTPQRIELLRLQADAAIANENPLQAATHLLTLSEIVLREEQTMRARQQRQLQTAPGSWSSLDSWIAARLKQVNGIATEPQQVEIDAMVAAHVEPLRREPPAIRKRVIDQLGHSPAIDSIREDLFTAAVEEGTLAQAERLALAALVKIDAAAEPDRFAHWNRRLAELYVSTGFAEDAAQIVQQIPTDATADAAMPAELRQQIAEATEPHPWPAGVRMKVRDDRSRQQITRDRIEPLDPVFRRGATMAGWLPQSNIPGGLLLRDRQGNNHPIAFDSARNNDAIAQTSIDGGVMVLLMPEELVAVDLFALEQQGIDAVLWRRPWKSQLDEDTTRVQSVPDFLGENRRNFVYASGTPGSGRLSVMRLGPIVGQQMFMLLDTDLVAIDVVTNRELWRSGGHPSDAFIVADADQVAVVSPQGVQVHRSEDGERLRSVPWDGERRIHLAAGPHVLTSHSRQSAADQPPDQRVIQLHNPLTGNDVLTATLETLPNSPAPNAFGRILEGRIMAVVSGDGRALVWDLFEGRSIADTEVETGGELSGINAMLWGDQVLISATRRGDRQEPAADGGDSADAAGQTHITSGQTHVETDGPIHAISLEDGSLRWSRDLEGPWGYTLTQPTGSPLMILTRAVRSYPNAGRPVRQVDVLAIDTRDGSIAYRVEDMGVESNFNAISTDASISPEQNTVDVQMGHYVFQFEFVEDRLPEEERTIGGEAISAQLEESRQEAGQVPELSPLGDDIFGPQP